MSTRPDPQSFDALPEVFDRIGVLRAGELEAYVTEHASAAGGGRAVDLGCGTGLHAVLLADHFDDVLGVDVSAPMLEFARSRRGKPNIAYQERDLRDVHRDRDGTFQLVLSAHTLHHVDDLTGSLAQIRDLVAPGGQAMLLDIVMDEEVTDERGLVPASTFVADAVRTFARAVRAFADSGDRHFLGDAAEMLELNVHPDWLAHVTTDRFLTPQRFDEHYLGAFPGGKTVQMGPARLLHYQDAATGTGG